jgi:hypothetical protein
METKALLHIADISPTSIIPIWCRFWQDRELARDTSCELMRFAPHQDPTSSQSYGIFDIWGNNQKTKQNTQICKKARRGCQPSTIRGRPPQPHIPRDGNFHRMPLLQIDERKASRKDRLSAIGKWDEKWFCEVWMHEACRYWLYDGIEGPLKLRRSWIRDCDISCSSVS